MPRGSPSATLREVVGVAAGGRPRGILGDDRLMAILGNFPLSSLAAFGDLGIDNAAVAGLAARFGRRDASAWPDGN